MSLYATEKLTGKNLIELYKFEHSGTKILLDVKNVNYFEIDHVTDGVLDVLLNNVPLSDLTERYSSAQISKAVKDLEENDFLIMEDQEVFQPEYADEINIVNLVLNVAHDCNLRCKYCFASTGHYKGKRGFMSEEVAKRSLDWFVEQSGENRNLNMHFFGGEPLLNLPLVKIIIDYVHELEGKFNKKIFMNICTNGTVFNDEIIDLIKRNDIGIQISLDGPKEIQDKYRPFSNGSGTYDIILQNINRLFREIPVTRIIPRATIPHGLVKINEVVEHLFDIGFKIVFFIPALGCGNFIITESDLENVKKQYNQLADKFIEKNLNKEDYNVFPFGTEVQSIGEGVKRLYGCGAGLGFASIAVNGDIYPCMRFTNNTRYRLGDVFNGFDTQQRKMFFNRTVEQRNKCAYCWARYLCGGACVSIPAETGDDIRGNDEMTCELAKHIVKLAMYVNAELSRNGIEYDKSKLEVFDFMRRRFQ